ncbi:hypothetical protein BGZ60DRAFT_417051 [Tricladium varicosporioides]|nr:hypothetical protein BGZ60DRAFT_417051 [Hymenoscyphus varicosporioides]
MAPKQLIPGILMVNSDVIKPEKLSKSDFDKWYCDTHIHEVMAKRGISHAYRYEHVSDGTSPDRRLSYLTIYGMPDIQYTETEDFRGLEGQKPGPNRERIFENAEFDTRTYEEVQRDEKPGAEKGPAKYLLYAAMNHTSDSALDAWYRGEHVRTISECPNYRRMVRYKLATRSLLSGFERSFPENVTWLALHEFDDVVPWKELAATDETEWAKKVIPGIQDIDFGLFELKRVYEKEGREKARL